MKKLFAFIISLNILFLVPSAKGDFFLEMLEEAEIADRKDTRKLGTQFDTKEQVVAILLEKDRTASPSKAFERFKEGAISYITNQTSYYEKGLQIFPPWTQIAYIGLGCDEKGELAEKLKCLVALADFRNLPKFRIFLDQLIKDVDLRTPDAMAILSERFSSLRV